MDAKMNAPSDTIPQPASSISPQNPTDAQPQRSSSRPAVAARALAPRPSDDGSGSSTAHAGAAGTPASSKKRPPQAARGVATMTPERLARKRANDREAQRAVRERTKAQIRGLQDEVLVLKGDQAQLHQVLQENSALQAENEAIKQAMAQLVKRLDSQSLIGPGQSQHHQHEHHHQHQHHHHHHHQRSKFQDSRQKAQLLQLPLSQRQGNPSAGMMSASGNSPSGGSAPSPGSPSQVMGHSAAHHGSSSPIASVPPLQTGTSSSNREARNPSPGYNNPNIGLVLPGIHELTRGSYTASMSKSSPSTSYPGGQVPGGDMSAEYERALLRQRDQMAQDMSPSTSIYEKVNLHFVTSGLDTESFPRAFGEQSSTPMHQSRVNLPPHASAAEGDGASGYGPSHQYQTHQHQNLESLHPEYPPHRDAEPRTTSPRAFASSSRIALSDLTHVDPPLSAFAIPSPPMLHALSSINATSLSAAIASSSSSGSDSNDNKTGVSPLKNKGKSLSSSVSLVETDIIASTEQEELFLKPEGQGISSGSSRDAGISNSNSSAEDVRMRDAGSSSDGNSSCGTSITGKKGAGSNKAKALASDGNSASNSDNNMIGFHHVNNITVLPTPSSSNASSRAPSSRLGHGHSTYSHASSSHSRSRSFSSTRTHHGLGHSHTLSHGHTSNIHHTVSPLIKLNIAHVPATCVIDELLLNLLASQSDPGRAIQPEIATLLTPVAGSYESLRSRLDPVSAVLSDIISSFESFQQLPERVAVMYSSFMLMKYLVNSTTANYERVPTFLLPLQDQLQTPHAAWIDIFPFPHARLRLINDKATNNGNSIMSPASMERFFSTYLACFSINWPYEDTDVLLLTPGNELIINPVFDRHVRRLENWTLAPEFLEAYPDFTHLVNIRERST